MSAACVRGTFSRCVAQNGHLSVSTLSSSNTFAPHSVFVYACGFLFFAVVPYYLLQGKTSIQRPWLELSLLFLRLGVSAILIIIGWVTTVGAISILTRKTYLAATKN
jgi:hypothetical protein